MLLKAGADANRVDDIGRTPLILMVVNYERMAESLPAMATVGPEPGLDMPMSEEYQIVKALLDHGAHPNAQDMSKRAALHYTAVSGNLECSKLLLQDYGATVDLEDDTGRTPLWHAAEGGFSEIAELLLDHGAQPWLSDLSGMTVLMAAARSGHLETVRLLIRRSGDMDALRLVRMNGRGSSAVAYAAREGFTRLVELLLANGALVDEPAWLDNVHVEPGGRISKFVGVLRANGMCLDSNLGLPLDALPLIWTVRHHGDNPELLSLLLEKGAVADGRDERGWTALMEAAFGGHADAMGVLLRGGASTELKDKEGETALHAAARGGNVRAVQILIDAGAEVGATNASGRTPSSIVWSALWGDGLDPAPELVDLLCREQKYGE